MSPSETYFYRLVAVDAAGNRSDPTDPVVARVGYPDIPKPTEPVLKLATAPSTGVTLQFDKAPAGFSVVVERQDSPSSGWLRVTGPIDGTTAADFPPAGNTQARYRIAYIAPLGHTGDSSAPVALPGIAK